jgi:ferredoxin
MREVVRTDPGIDCRARLSVRARDRLKQSALRPSFKKGAHRAAAGSPRAVRGVFQANPDTQRSRIARRCRRRNRCEPVMSRSKPTFIPQPDQMALWPGLSGNAINGLGEREPRAPRPIYWHEPERTPHGPLQRWFHARSAGHPVLAQARARRQEIIDAPLAPLNPTRTELSPHAAVDVVKRAAREAGADLVGIAQVRPEWVFEGFDVPQRWVVMIGVAHEYENIRTAPQPTAAAEVVRQYGRGNFVAKAVASAVRSLGHEAVPHGGPLAGPMLLIPPAIECGFGELGKHGSIINRTFGSSFRLASVLTDLPLLQDREDAFGADDFCLHCRVCAQECPPDAIAHEKQLVRGVRKWYVDFDKCLPYFNETMGCGICIAVCPFSRPGVAPNLVDKLRQRSRRLTDAGHAIADQERS